MQSTPCAESETTSRPSSSVRTCPESSLHATTLSVASLQALPAKTSRWSRQGESGRTLVLCLDPKGQSLGGPLTPNFSDWPNDAAVCSLSQVLGPNVAISAMQVRRLTPTECERLQGFPDGYTAVPWRKKSAGECPDGPRYKALGNSWAVPVVRWIGRRIDGQLIGGLI